MTETSLLLGVDTCGTSGSIALAKSFTARSFPNRQSASSLALPSPEPLGERRLEGGDYAATLVSAVADLLDAAGASIERLSGIVVVSGPGSFTGIRVGLAAVKAFAEATSVPIVAISRLALLADVARQTNPGVQSAVLDAHRGQFFCGLYPEGEPARELLLTAGEINSMGGLPLPVAVCEEAVAQTLEMLLEVEPLRVTAPSAWHALQFGSPSWAAREFADAATLDGYYLRGADAKPGSR